MAKRDRDKRREAQRRYMERHPEQREAARKRCREWRANNLDRERQRGRLYRQKVRLADPQRYANELARKREARSKDPEGVRSKEAARRRRRQDSFPDAVKMQRQRNSRKSTFGITDQEFLAMLASQGNRCAICRTRSPTGKGWHLDHDHLLDRRDPRSHRGVVCVRCNSILGMASDSPKTLLRAVRYLLLARRRTRSAVTEIRAA